MIFYYFVRLTAVCCQNLTIGDKYWMNVNGMCFDHIPREENWSGFYQTLCNLKLSSIFNIKTNENKQFISIKANLHTYIAEQPIKSLFVLYEEVEVKKLFWPAYIQVTLNALISFKIN